MRTLKNIPFLILLIFSHNSFSQIPKWTDLKIFGGIIFDKGAGITVDEKNNYYLTGNISNAQNVGMDSLNINCGIYTNPPNYTTDGFLLRYDSLKKLNLVLKIPLGKMGRSAVDRMGNIYVSGNYDYGATSDGFLIKYSSSGNMIWEKKLESFLGSNDDAITSMDVTKDGVIIFCGFSSGQQVSILGQLIIGPANFIAKATTDGNIIWISKISSTLGYGAYRVKFDNDYNILFAGNEIDSLSKSKGIIAKINGQNGSYIWKQNFSTSGIYVPFVNSIGVLSDGYVFGGIYGGNIDIAGNLFTSKGNTDIFILKCDNSGIVKWVKSGGSNDRDVINYITTTSNDNIIFTGGYSNGFTFNNISYSAKGNLDVYIASLDRLGNTLWIKTGGSNIPGHTDDLLYDEYGTCLAIDLKNQIQVVGITIGSGNFGTLSFNFPESISHNVFWLTLGDKDINLNIDYPCKDSLTQDSLFSISVSPNPFTNILVIRNSKNIITNYDLTLYNSIGQKVKQSNYKNVSTLTINNWGLLSQGMYFLTIRSEKYFKTFKLIKN